MTALIERMMLRGPHGSVILDQSTTAQPIIIIRDTDNGQIVGLFAESPASLIGIRPKIYPHQGYSCLDTEDVICTGMELDPKQ